MDSYAYTMPATKLLNAARHIPEGTVGDQLFHRIVSKANGRSGDIVLMVTPAEHTLLQIAVRRREIAEHMAKRREESFSHITRHSTEGSVGQQ